MTYGDLKRFDWGEQHRHTLGIIEWEGHIVWQRAYVDIWDFWSGRLYDFYEHSEHLASL